MGLPVKITTLSIALCLFAMTLMIANNAQAIPPFARKYNLTCTACHTAPPRLNPYGERFLENGYQLPGTENGGITGKRTLGDVSLDDVANYLGVRLRGNVLRNHSVKQQNPPGSDPGVAENKTEFGFPEVFSLFAAGTLTKNIGFFTELESNLEEGTTGIERAFLTFNNLGGRDLAHIRVGRIDPSASFSFSTLRQQLEFVGEHVKKADGAFMPQTINRAGLFPLATAAKFYGLFHRDGTALSPYAPSLYNGVAEMGVDVRGRPFGDWLLYQFGVLNGANEGFGDSGKAKDFYGMVRLDYSRSNFFSASLSGFTYFGNGNVRVRSGEDVNWNRYGVAANVRYEMIDIYGLYTADRIARVPTALAADFDATATGLTVAADAYVTSNTLLSVRYDHMDAGGELDQRSSQTFVGFQVKQYLRTNVAIYARDDMNLRKSEGGAAAARNLRNAFFAGIDVVF